LKLHIVARGRIGRGPEADLVARYAKRIVWPLIITELPETGGKVAELTAPARVIALDEAGDQLSSTAFAKLLENWRDEGIRDRSRRRADRYRARERRPQYFIRFSDLASPDGPGIARRTALPRNHDHSGASLPPRGIAAPCDSGK
jgi:hypothetical protein